MTKVIIRGRVHIIKNEQGKISSITDEGRVRVAIRQREVHTIDGYVKNVVKEHYMEGPIELLKFPLRQNTILPGNIHVIQQTETYNEDDPMEALLWKDGKVVRTECGKAIYEIKWYDEQENFEPEKEFDKFLVAL